MTVVIPIYNDAKFIQRSIQSVVNQVENIIISDNSSSDDSLKICKELATEYKHITVIEQKQNLGAVKNLILLYDYVTTKYVIHMGSHDMLSEDFIDTLLHCFDNNNDIVMAYAPIKWINEDDNFIGDYKIDDLAHGVANKNIFTRVYTLIKYLKHCSIIYGLCKTKEFKQSLDVTPVAAVDHVILTNLVTHGKLKRCDKTVFYERIKDRENNEEEYMKRMRGDLMKSTYNLSYMIKRQLEIIDSIKTPDVEDKIFYCQLAREALKDRFAGKGGRIDYRPFIDSCTLSLQQNT